MPAGAPEALALLRTQGLLYNLPWVLVLSVHQGLQLPFLTAGELAVEVM